MELLKKIDIHVHSIRVPGVPRDNGQNFASPAQLREMYRTIGVEKAVLLPPIATDCAYSTATNEDIMEIAQANSDLFFWFCNIDPRAGWNNGDTDFTRFLNFYKERGARGVGEITSNLYFDDPRVLALFRACEKCEMPLTFHIGHTNGEYGLIDELHLPRLEKVLQMFPKLKFLAHSQRFWSEISGDADEVTRHGWPTGKVTPGGAVVRLMRRYENLCGDLSAGSGYNAMTRDPEFGYAFLEEFQDRLFYGTDICAPENIHHPMLKLAEFLDQGVLTGKLSYTAYEKISRGNALKLLGEK